MKEQSYCVMVKLVNLVKLIFCFRFQKINKCQAVRSLQYRRIFGAGALNNPSLLSSWTRKRERAGASQK